MERTADGRIRIFIELEPPEPVPVAPCIVCGSEVSYARELPVCAACGGRNGVGVTARYGAISWRDHQRVYAAMACIAALSAEASHGR